MAPDGPEALPVLWEARMVTTSKDADARRTQRLTTAVFAVCYPTEVTEETLQDTNLTEVNVGYSVENPDAAGILERVRGALREGGVGDEEIEAYTTEATSRCYNHLLLTTMTWVRIHWDVPGYAATP